MLNTVLAISGAVVALGAGRGLPERHPALDRLAQRQPPRRSELALL